ncbi:MAG TPA: hypothetical protein VJ825_01235 [Gemmatimonadaceae bacterium]|nr:hypothetical protein [Gemmatimonadaceae bacterium]
MHLAGKLPKVALLFAAFACAPATPRPNTKPRAETVTIDVPNAPSSRLTIRDDPSGSTAALTVSAAQAWTALPAAFNALGIPIAAMDSAGRFVRGATTAYHQFQRSQVSRFVDCGSSLVGPNADAYHVQLVIESQIDSVSASSSTVRTHVDATGSGSGATVRCSTTGSLERLINDQIKALLGISQ